MKLFSLSLLSFLLIGLSSCSEDDEEKLVANRFYGTWDVESIKINGTDSTNPNDVCSVNNETITINEDQTFTWNKSESRVYQSRVIATEGVDDDCDGYVDNGSWDFTDGKLVVTVNNYTNYRQAIVIEPAPEGTYSFSYSNGKVVLTEDEGKVTTYSK